MKSRRHREKAEISLQKKWKSFGGAKTPCTRQMWLRKKVLQYKKRLRPGIIRRNKQFYEAKKWEQHEILNENEVIHLSYDPAIYYF